ncbi:MAG: TolB-like protein, partial [Rhodothermales bacterium]
MSFFEELKRRNVFRVGVAYGVAAWVLLQVADLVLENIAAPPWVIQALMLVVGLGFIAALVIAWAYELTPEGIKREADVDRTQSVTSETKLKLDRIIIGFLVLAVVYFVYESRFAGQPEMGSDPFSNTENLQAGDEVRQKRALTPGLVSDLAEAKDSSGAEEPVGNSGHQSIAVLPFVNMSADADNEYFSDGISEELLNVLVKVSSLRVASRTSAFAYKGKEIAIDEIARQLGVDHILEGSVRKAGNTVRITAQLIDGRTDRHVWSETYERQLDDIFDIQEEISNAIVDALKIALNVDEQEAVGRALRPTENTVAYELYLQGRYRWRQRQEDNIRAAIGLFEQAVAIDPDFAVVYEALAAAHASLSSWSDVSRSEALAIGGEYAEKALSLDPMLSEARAVTAESLAEQHRWEETIEQYKTAVSNTPTNPTVIMWYAEILHNLGYLELALETVLQAYKLDPASPVVNNVTSYIAVSAQQDELAFKHSKISAELGLERASAQNIEPLRIKRGEIDLLIEGFGWQENEVPLCIQARKNSALKPQLLQELQAIDLDNPGPNDNLRNIANCLAFAGEPETAMEIIKNIAVQENWYAINEMWAHTDEIVQMRQSEQFKQMVTGLGLDIFWRNNGWP